MTVPRRPTMTDPTAASSRDLLCPDCGHHIHRPKPGKCGWYDCPCSTMPDQTAALEAWFAKHHDGGMHPTCFGHGACMAEQAEAEIARLRKALERIAALPVGHLRRNGFASPDPWLRQREVRRIVRAALEEAE